MYSTWRALLWKRKKCRACRVLWVWIKKSVLKLFSQPSYVSLLVWSKLLAAAIHNVRYAIRMSPETVLLVLQVQPCSAVVLKHHRFYFLSLPNIVWKSQLHINQPVLYHAQGSVTRLKITFWTKGLALEISESNLKAIRYGLLFAAFQQRLQHVSIHKYWLTGGSFKIKNTKGLLWMSTQKKKTVCCSVFSSYCNDNFSLL